METPLPSPGIFIFRLGSLLCPALPCSAPRILRLRPHTLCLCKVHPFAASGFTHLHQEDQPTCFLAAVLRGVQQRCKFFPVASPRASSSKRQHRGPQNSFIYRRREREPSPRPLVALLCRRRRSPVKSPVSQQDAERDKRPVKLQDGVINRGTTGTWSVVHWHLRSRASVPLTAVSEAPCRAGKLRSSLASSYSVRIDIDILFGQ